MDDQAFDKDRWFISQLRGHLRGDESQAELAAQLSQCHELHGGAVAFSAIQTLTHRVFSVMMSRGHPALVHLRQILQEGTVSARLYAAFGIYLLDRAEGETALRQLQNCQVPVTYRFGCAPQNESAAYWATQLLEDGHMQSECAPRYIND